MLYTMFDIEWKISGDTLGITFLERYVDKFEFVNALPTILEDYRRHFSILSRGTSDEALDNAILEASVMRIASDVENLKLTGKTWQIGICRFKICFAEQFPAVLKGFLKAVKTAYPVDYKAYAATWSEDDPFFWNVRFYTAFHALRRVNSRTSQKNFDRTFDLLAGCLNDEGRNRTLWPIISSKLQPADAAQQ